MRKELACCAAVRPRVVEVPGIEPPTPSRTCAPPVRDTPELKKMAVSRLGKDVVDSRMFPPSMTTLDARRQASRAGRSVTWRLPRRERTGNRANGAGKSTMLSW